MLSFTLPRTVHLAAQALPAAGAFTAQDFQVLPPGTRELIYWITYTRVPGTTGAPVFDAQWSDDVDESSELILDEGSFVAAAPLGTVNVYMARILGPVPADDNPVSYVLSYIVPYGATKFRLLCAEIGAVATPGTIAVAVTGGTGAP